MARWLDSPLHCFQLTLTDSEVPDVIVRFGVFHYQFDSVLVVSII